MARPLLVLAVALTVPALVASCVVSGDEGPEHADPSDATDASAASEAAASEPDASPTTDGPAGDEPEAEPSAADRTVPAGIFPSLEALCVAQRALVGPRIAELRKEREASGSTEIDAEPIPSPRCELAPASLAKVDVRLRSPFLEVRAISVETGNATAEHLVVRTAEGWRALPHAHVAEFHMDPGCFSIERETGVVAVRVEGASRPALVLLDGADRGARMEDDVPGQDLVTWDDVSRRAVACRLDGAEVTCDAPVVLRVERVPSTRAGGRAPKLRFETTYAVDAEGRVQPARRIEDANLSHDD